MFSMNATVAGIYVLLVLLAIAGAVLTVIFNAKAILFFMKGPLRRRIAHRYGAEAILMEDLTANSFGLQSKGVLQARGNGALVLTRKELHFFMFLPQSEIRIPLAAITGLVLTKSHLGKATIHDLLKVSFDRDGKPDSIAWYVADAGAWKRKLEELMNMTQNLRG